MSTSSSVDVLGATAINLRHILEMGSTKWATVFKLKGKQHSVRCIQPVVPEQCYCIYCLCRFSSIWFCSRFRWNIKAFASMFVHKGLRDFFRPVTLSRALCYIFVQIPTVGTLTCLENRAMCCIFILCQMFYYMDLLLSLCLKVRLGVIGYHRKLVYRLNALLSKIILCPHYLCKA